MRSAWIRRVVASVLGAAALGGGPAWANGFFGRAVGLAPTEFVAVAPTSYFVPTSYLLPTNYVATSYVETSYTLSPTAAYVVPTVYSYAPTTYVVPSAYVVPTTYLVPTAFHDYAVVSTSFDCAVPCATPCETTTGAVVEAPRSSGAAPSKGAKAEGDSKAPVQKPPATLDSIPANEPAGSGAAEATAPTTKSKPNDAPSPSQITPLDSSVPTPPVAPVPDKEPALGAGGLPAIEPAPLDRPVGEAAKPTPVPAPGDKPAPAGGGSPPAAKPPVAPGGEQTPTELGPPLGEEATLRRQVQRPVLSTATRASQPYRHPTKNGSLTALQGRVLALESRDGEEGVQITLSNRLQTFADRVVTSDALGRYAVWLPDGDWTVKVTMPSGRSYAVSQLTVVQGQITDDQGRDIPSLTITR